MKDKIYFFSLGMFIPVSIFAAFNIFAPKVYVNHCYGGYINSSQVQMPRVALTHFDSPDDKEVLHVFLDEAGTFKDRLALLIGEIKEVECPKQLEDLDP